MVYDLGDDNSIIVEMTRTITQIIWAGVLFLF